MMFIADLYDTYSERLMGYAVTVARDPDVAEDLVQETFSRAIANLELLRILSESERRSWLYRVLKNCYIDKRRRDSKVEFDSDLHELSGGAVEIESEIVSRADAMKLISKLSGKFRDVVFKKYWLGMTCAEIARVLRIPAATVRWRLHTALKLLQTYQEIESNGIQVLGASSSQIV